MGTNDALAIGGKGQAAQVEGILNGSFPVQFCSLGVPAAHLGRTVAGRGQPASVAGKGQVMWLARGRPAQPNLPPVEVNPGDLFGNGDVKRTAVRSENQATGKGADRHLGNRFQSLVLNLE